MATKKPIIKFRAPILGQIPNEYNQSQIGAQLIQQCDITEEGIIKVAEAISADKAIASVATDFEYFDDRSGNGTELYAIAGKVIWRKRSGTWTSAHTNGQTVTAGSFQFLKAYDYAKDATTKKCLYYTSDTYLGSYYFSGTEQWDDDEETFANADTKAHPLETMRGYLYAGDGNNVARLEPLGASWDDDALVMTDGYRALCMRPYNDRLCIGTFRGSALFDVEDSRLFIWQGIAGVEEEDFPALAERGITAMEVYQGRLWLFAGTKGHIYKYNGATFPPAPFEINGVTRQVYVKPGAVAVVDGSLLFGLSDDNADASETALQGVYRIYRKTTDRKFSLSMPYLESGGSKLLNQIGAIEGNIAGTAFNFSTYNSSVYNIDISSANKASLATQGVMESQVYQIAFGDNGRTVESFELLARVLPADTSVRIDYKQDGASSWTTNSYTFTSSNQNLLQKVGLKNCKTLQLKIYLIASGATTPSLYGINVW